LGIGDWGLGIGSNPQSPIPNPQSLFDYEYKFMIKIYSIIIEIIIKFIINIINNKIYKNE